MTTHASTIAPQSDPQMPGPSPSPDQQTPPGTGIVPPRSGLAQLLSAAAGVGILIGLFVVSRHNFLLFHGLAELFSITVAWSVFIFVWNCRRLVTEQALILLGVAFLCVGLIDLLHTLAYKGMGVFAASYGANLPTQLWIAARYLESLCLLAFVLLLGRRLNLNLVVGIYAAVTAALVAVIFFTEAFPVCFVDGQGLTGFKKASEYLICLILAGTAVLLWQKRASFDPAVLRLLLASIVLTICAELAFTFYISVYGLSNLVGHYFKILSFFMIYLALLRSGVTNPHSFLFRDLAASERRYRLLVEEAPISIMAFDARGVVTFVNPYHLKTFAAGKHGPGFFEGQKVTELPGIVRAGVASQIEKVLGGTPVVLDEVFFPKFTGGHSGYQSIKAVPFWQEGQVTGGLLLREDITEKNQRVEALRRSEEKFRAAFNNTPLMIGILAIDGGKILEVNDAFADLTGYTRDEALGKRAVDLGLVDPGDMDRIKTALDRQGRVKAMGIQMAAKGGDRLDTAVWAQVSQVEGGCAAVGIRLQEGHDYPYYETRGFPEAFVKAESRLCACDGDGTLLCDDLGAPILECMCGNILRERFDPSLPFFTANGSFWTNSTTRLLASTSEADRQARTRNRCNGEGYESVALVPLRFGGQTFGLLQINDHRPDRFSPATIALYERLATKLALALQGRRNLDALADSEKKFRLLYENAPVGIFTSSSRGQLLSANPALVRMLGCDSAEQAVRQFNDVGGQLYPDRHKRDGLTRRIDQDGRVAGFEIETKTMEGRRVWINISARLSEAHADGSFTMEGFAVDVTAKNQTQQAFDNERRLLDSILSTTPDMFVLKGTDNVYRKVNPAFCQFLGRAEADILGRKDSDLFPPDEAAQYVEGDQAVMTTGTSQTGDWLVTGEKGKKWLQVIKTAIQDDQGQATGLLCSVRDVSERKNAEQLRQAVLERRQAQTQVLFVVAASTHIAVGDVAALATLLTQAAAAALGVERVGLWLFDEPAGNLVCQDQFSLSQQRHDKGAVLSPLESVAVFEALDAAPYVAVDDPLNDPRTAGYVDGYLKPLGITAVLDAAIRAGGVNRGVLCFEHIGRSHHWQPDEITFACQLADQVAIAIANQERLEAVTAKAAAARFIEAQKRTLETILNGIPDVIGLMKPDRTVISYNTAGYTLLGKPPSQVNGRKCFELRGSAVPCADCAVALAIGRGQTVAIEKHIPELDRWFLANAIPVFDETGAIVQIVEQLRDITKSHQQQVELRRLASAIDQAGEAIMITAANGRIVYVNPAFEALTGLPAVQALDQHHRIIEMADPAAGLAFQSSLDNGSSWQGRVAIRRPDATEPQVQVSVSPVVSDDGTTINCVTVMRDLTAEIRMEEKLSQAQKMEAIGTLAGGIAHDFNNILFPLVGFAEMLKEDIPGDSPLQDNIDTILTAALRARDLVKQILTFSRQSNQERSAVRLQSILKEVLKLARASLPSNITIQQDISPSCPMVIADPTQVHQVAMNLITNAYHAMEETGGQLVVSLHQEKVTPASDRSTMLQPGLYACVRVSDTGQGIDGKILDRIFEPYFTTKKDGKGTGLGLSVIHGIVTGYGGQINVDSRPGQGTTFKVYLPCQVAVKPKTETQDEGPIIGGDERVLLVDDEHPVVAMVSRMLAQLGYQVTTRTSSIEALEIFRARPEQFDVVITDMTMPNMTGDKLAAAIKRIRSDLPVIICTGFSEHMDEEKAKAMGLDGFVCKPILRRQLSAMIRRLLDSRNEATIV